MCLLTDISDLPLMLLGRLGGVDLTSNLEASLTSAHSTVIQFYSDPRQSFTLMPLFTKQYKLVWAKGNDAQKLRRVTAGLVGSNGSLLLGI